MAIVLSLAMLFGSISVPQVVVAADAQADLSQFYTYADSAGGVRVSLNPNFQTALKNNQDYKVDETILWHAGDPLPNPAPNGLYEGKPVVSMWGMFQYCTAASLDLANFDTRYVTDMSHMFYRCSALKNLNVSSFDTSQVTSMSGMFYGCSSLAKINVRNFNTSSVVSMTDMFFGCSSLQSLDLSSFDLKPGVSLMLMFSETCSQSGKKVIGIAKNQDIADAFNNSVGFDRRYLEFKIHIHDFRYELSEDMTTVIAVCLEPYCSLDPANPPSISFNKLDATYDGAEKGVSLDDINWKITGLAVPSEITYSTDTGMPPVNAGTYDAKTTIGDAEKAVELKTSFEIKRADRSDIRVSVANYTYGEKVSTPSVTGTVTDDATPVYYYNNTDSNKNGILWSDLTGTTLNPGIYYVYAVYPETINYNEFSTPASTFTVIARDKAEEKDDGDNKNNKNDKNSAKVTKLNSKTPKTGDSSSVGICVLLMMVGMSGIAGIFIFRRKEK